jgi:hypothetical protein
MNQEEGGEDDRRLEASLDPFGSLVHTRCLRSWQLNAAGPARA